MLTASLCRKTLLLVWIAVLALPWAAGAGPTFETPQSGRVFERADPDLLDRLLSLFGAWDKEGCDIDPDGRCIEKPPSPQTKEGCGIDPNGRPFCKP
jgi:hypothetical protein